MLSNNNKGSVVDDLFNKSIQRLDVLDYCKLHNVNLSVNIKRFNIVNETVVVSK